MTAYFNNLPNVDNIISRVTGGAVSQIDGSIGANGSANLFLINPSGIIFGPNAHLEIGGSFIASTADSLKFADGIEFSASDPTTPPLLTVSVPVGLQFGRTPGPIVNRSQFAIDTPFGAIPIGLQVQAGRTLALVGGNVSLEGGTATAGSFSSEGGRIELGSVAPDSFVKLTPSAGGWQLSYSNVEQFQDIELSQRAFVGADSGSIVLQGRHITLAGGSQIVGAALGSTAGGNIAVNASESLQIVGNTGEGFPSGLFTAAVGETSGASVSLNVNTRHLSVREGGAISAGTTPDSNRDGGDLTIEASESIEVAGTGFGPSQINTNTLGAGKGGNLSLTTQRLSVRDGGLIEASTESSGEGGLLAIEATEFIEVSGKGVRGVDGREAPSRLAASSVTGFFAGSPATGRGGNLTLKTGELRVSSGAEVTASSSSSGDAGTLAITAESVRLDDGSQILAASEGSGNGGNLSLEADRLRVLNGSAITASSSGSGNAGNLAIRAGTLFLDNGGELSAETASGEGGNIDLQVEDFLILRHRSLISTTAGTQGGGGNGGNIDISTQFLIASDNSDIMANAFTGSGGNVTISATGIFGIEPRDRLTPLSDITASSDFGQAGIVALARVDVDPQSSLLQVPVEVADPKDLVVQRCTSSRELARGEFVVTGRGGLPPDPLERIRTDAGLADLGYLTPNLNRQNSKETPGEADQSKFEVEPTGTTPASLVEARGWVVDRDGKVVLVAQVPAGTVPEPGQASPSCHDLQTPPNLSLPAATPPVLDGPRTPR